MADEMSGAALRVHLKDIKPGMIVSPMAYDYPGWSRRVKWLITGVHPFTFKTKTVNGKSGKRNGRPGIALYMRFLGDNNELEHERIHKHLATSNPIYYLLEA